MNGPTVDIMLDLETWGTGRDAVVVQVGACYFNRMTGEIGQKFKKNVNARTYKTVGGKIDADTIYWWMQQSQAARDSIMTEPLEDAKFVFEALNKFLCLRNGEVLPKISIWSHATFDFPIVVDTMKRFGIKQGFSYRAAKDIRTLMDLAGMEGVKFERPSELVHHDALADCIFQVRYCVQAFNKLKGVSTT